MRRLVPLAAVAALSSLATAAIVVLPALAEGDRATASLLRDANRPFAEEFGRFADCMRERGFPFDGEVRVQSDGDGVTVNGKDVHADDFRAAEKACGGPPFRGVRNLPPPGELPPLGRLPGREELLEQREAFLTDVAERLGVDVATLEDALRGAAVARVDALEREGKIGEPQADALRELARSGGLPLLHGLGPLGPRPALEPPAPRAS
jgi:hypothetical protein